MKQINTGGQAFPSPAVKIDGATVSDKSAGMSYRRYLAAKAMQGELAAGALNINTATREKLDEMTKLMWAIADSMIATEHGGGE